METRNNRDFLQSLIDYLPMLIYARSVRRENYGQMVVWNEAAEAITGYSVQSVVGHASVDCFPPQLDRQFEALDRQIIEDPKVIEVAEIPFERRNGGQRFLHLISVPLFDHDNQVEYILGIAEDITTRRRQELELRTQQAELAAANDASPLGLFRTAPDGSCTYVNRTYLEMSGLTREQALGGGWARAIHPEDRLKVFQAWGKSSRTRKPYQGIYRFRHANGRIVWVSVKTAPVVVDGHIEGYVGSVDDITARRESEQALRDSEARLRTIADSLPAMVAYVDANEHFRFNNIAYEKMFGIRREQMHGKPVREVMGDAIYERVAPYIKRALQGEKVVFELEEQDDDNYRCIERTYIPQRSDDGREVVGFHVMNQDVTTKKLEEKRLMQLAQVDSLTGVVNRAGFMQRLTEVMAHCKVSHELMALMYMDIDNFKTINDTFGHQAGDALLKGFVGRLTGTLRSSDTVARLGGDEFTVIMEKLTKPEDAATVAGKILQAVQPAFMLDDMTVSVTVSIGLAFYQGGASDRKTLIRQADEMLYMAKGAGRNTYRIAPLPQA